MINIKEDGCSVFSSLPFKISEIKQLSCCTLCPRNCKADRFSEKLGFCKSDALFRIAAVCDHKGEESIISGEKGICNIFFPHCNLQCVYCQNYQISHNRKSDLTNVFSYEDLIHKICSVLDRTENIVGFISPSHYIPHMLAIIRGIKATGRNPVFVYNTNGYDSVDTLKLLEDYIDVYLPDFKYMDPEIAYNYSQARDYPVIAAAAIKEMYRQKGSSLILNESGIIQWGIVLRHLVLPGAVKQSIDVLKFLAEEISTGLYLSLMSQYTPVKRVYQDPQLNRTISQEEYQQVLEALYDLGFYHGWTQDLNSHDSYLPDFSEGHPFHEKK